MNAGRLDHGCYGFRFFDEMPEPAVQMESVGMELRDTREYYFDGMLRKERNRFLFQYTISGSGMFMSLHFQARRQSSGCFIISIGKQPISK